MFEFMPELKSTVIRWYVTVLHYGQFPLPQSFQKLDFV